MRFRSTLLLLLLLAALALLLCFYEFPRREKEQKEKEGSNRLLALEEKNVRKITLWKGERLIALAREGETGWIMEQPVADRADSHEVSSLLSLLGSLKFERVVEEDVDHPEKFGLDRPEFKVRLDLKGEPSRTLKLGRKSPVGEGRYLCLEGMPKVYLVAGTISSALDKEPFVFRNKSPLDLLFESVTNFSIHQPGGTLELQRVLTDWEIIRPENLTADREEVENFLRRVSYLRIEAFLDENPSDLKFYGLQEPALTLRVKTRDGEQALFIGNIRKEPSGDELAYARRSGHPAIFTLRASVLDDMKKQVSDFQPKEAP